MSINKTEIECTIYRSLKKDETYVFLPVEKTLAELPADLLKMIGQTEKVMNLMLTAEKKMARGTAAEIMNSIEAQGFYLQMPINPQLNVNALPSFNERFLDRNI
jgi:hypothetical protein